MSEAQGGDRGSGHGGSGQDGSGSGGSHGGGPLNGGAGEGFADAGPAATDVDDAAAGEVERPARAEAETSPARELSLHLLRMLETRMDAAGIALQGETQLLLARLQLKLFAAAAIFVAIWGGIVLLAIALPPDLRVPVLSAVVVGFVLLAVAAQLFAKRKASTHEVGSLFWFLDSLRQDLEVLSRTLNRNQRAPRPTGNGNKGASHDLAA